VLLHGGLEDRVEEDQAQAGREGPDGDRCGSGGDREQCGRERERQQAGDRHAQWPAWPQANREGAADHASDAEGCRDRRPGRGAVQLLLGDDRTECPERREDERVAERRVEAVDPQPRSRTELAPAVAQIGEEPGGDAGSGDGKPNPREEGGADQEREAVDRDRPPGRRQGDDLCRSSRSAQTPPTSRNATSGTLRAASTKPSAEGEASTSRTANASATGSRPSPSCEKARAR
jgi:hypothetical protein